MQLEDGLGLGGIERGSLVEVVGGQGIYRWDRLGVEIEGLLGGSRAGEGAECGAVRGGAGWRRSAANQ